MSRLYRTACIILPLIASALLANAAGGPKIEFDVTSFNCGTVIEGKTEKLNAVFNVKNTGDALLRLQSVRPGCGCTVVKYDTLVPAGKTAKISAQVNIKGFRSGHLSKSITVTSNAANDSLVKLTIEATVNSVIDITESYLTLDASYEKTPRTVVVASKKADLKVVRVSFKSNDNAGAVTTGQKDSTILIKHAWSRTDSTRSDGSRVFKLDLYMPAIENPVSGAFIITTNHPDKPEINMPGALNK
jgi:Protein of unknown function (DUF1573)